MRTGFSPATMSKSLRAPLFTSNQLTFSPDTRGYESRIQEARGSFPGSDDWRKSTAFPYNIFTTDKNITNLPPQFEMWSLLNQSINIPDFPEPPHRDWDLSIADDDYMDRQVAEWVGTTGRWADLWAKLHTIPSPVLRADVYR
jgi:hypothetical protein